MAAPPIYATIQDITARKLADQQLREAEERTARSERQFRDLAESLPQFIWVADADGKKTYCNMRYLEYTGVESFEALDLGWKENIHPEDRPATAAAWDHSMKTGEPYLSEYRLRAKDGSYRTFLARGVAVRNSQGVIQRWLGSMTDIHDQKLAQEALRQSEKLAVAARLASSISHEINNPLEGLTNLVYLLSLNSSLDSIARDYLLLAEDQLARVTHLTTRTLRFHRQSTSATPIDVSATVDALLTLHHHELQAKGIEIRRRYNPVVPLRCFDADIRHAIGNIIGNAVHAVDAHGLLCIRVRRDSGLSGKDHGVRITIADDGSGISPEVLPHIFDAFFSTKGDRGTGLGLWIARGIVERHGGRISVRTSTHAGRSGTTFSVFVPYETTPSR